MTPKDLVLYLPSLSTLTALECRRFTLPLGWEVSFTGWALAHDLPRASGSFFAMREGNSTTALYVTAHVAESLVHGLSEAETAKVFLAITHQAMMRLQLECAEFDQPRRGNERVS